MPINMVIHEKRKEIGLTQEQIADYLGVSTPAVNKWERGATYPDITLLPALARLLKVDLNTLLCFNEDLSEQEITHFTEALSDEIKKNGLGRGFEMAMEKVREYPNCSSLIHTTALVLDGSLIMSGTPTDEREKFEETIIKLYERASKSEEDSIRNMASFMLASKYMNLEKYEDAQEILDTLPDSNVPDKKQLKVQLCILQDKLTEAGEILEQKLLTTLNGIMASLNTLAGINLKEGNPQNAAKIADISKEATKLFGLWDYNAFVTPLELAFAKKDVPEIIELVNSLLSSAKTPWKADKSPLFSHIAAQYMQKDATGQASRLLPPLLSEFETNPEYAFLQSNKDFQELIKTYRLEC